MLHTLLGISDMDTLLSHPILGQSWEGFVIEQVSAAAQNIVEMYYYRTAAGAEIDLLLLWPNQDLWAIEIKHSLQPKPSRGFYSACEDLTPQRRFVVYAGNERYPISNSIEAIGLRAFATEVLEKVKKINR